MKPDRMRSRIHAECALEAFQKASQKQCRMRSRSLAGSASGALQNALQKQCRMRSRSIAECAPKALLNTGEQPCRISSRSFGRMRSRSLAECATKSDAECDPEANRRSGHCQHGHRTTIPHQSTHTPTHQHGLRRLLLC